MSIFSKNIMWVREVLDLNQIELATMIKMRSCTQVWRWETGQGYPHERNLKKIADLINLPKKDWGLFYGVDLSKHEWENKPQKRRVRKKNKK